MKPTGEACASRVRAPKARVLKACASTARTPTARTPTARASKVRAFLLKLSVGAVAAGALTAGTLSASATTAPAGAEAVPDQPRQSYAAQLDRAGLTPGQGAALQGRVDGYLSRLAGGRQVSANRIEMPGGEITVGAPGQRSARDLALPPVSGALPAACRSGHLCLYRGSDSLDYYRCGTYNLTWTGDGTFNNNQTRGTRARFLNFDKVERWSSAAPETGTATWTPVYYVVPC
ncbi:hypothetical protein AB0O07_29650 [Streptomyces sp. NPDC093085]|uniref:hypothetical protein n=1 Tax=Streptomyces sp. NPDC093085 TaxID=3155068 RepID=UPI00342602C6